MATAAQIQAEAAALPQTQDALDALLVKYSPGDLAAAFPGYSQNDIDTARAAAEQREFIAWQASQPAVAGPGTVGDTLAAQGITDPKNDPRLLAQAQEQLDRAKQRQALFDQAGVQPAVSLAPWSEPNWRETQAAAQQAEAARQARIEAAEVAAGGPRTVVGGGLITGDGGGTSTRPTTPVGGGAGGGLLGSGGGTGAAGLPSGGTATGAANPRIQAIQQWYNSNVGRTDNQAQSDLNRFLATSGFTAREINSAIPQWGLNDLQNAMRTAIGEVAQQTPFAPVAAQPMQPLAQPYTSIASQLPGGADARAQEIQNWYAANAGRTDPQAQGDLERFLASGYSAQEINRALPQFDVPFLTSGISAARQQNPDAALQRQLAAYQATAPGAQFTGTVSPYGLLTQQTQAFRNPYADTLANVALGGYNPGVYNVLLGEKVDPTTGLVVPNEGGAGGASGGDEGSPGGQGGDAAGNTGGGPGTGAPGDAAFAHGGLVTAMFGPDPDGPDEGQINIQRGEYVIKKSAVKKYGKGLLDMINDGKVPAKKMKSLLG